MSTPFMQLYIGDYLRDTSGLTTEAHGAYLLIMFAMWNADGWVSADPRKMAMFARMTPARWMKIASDIMPYFTIEDGMATQGRLLKQLEKASGKSLKRSAAGKLGAQAKALKSQQAPQAIATANANAIADDLLKHLPETRNQIPESKEVSIAPVGAVSHETLPLEIPGFLDRRPKAKPTKSEPDGFAAFYAEYPRRTARPAAAKAYAAALSRASPDVLHAGAIRYAESRKDEDPKFTKHPATWLNQDCWQDEEPANDYRPAPTKNDNLLRGFFEAVVEANGTAGPSQECDDSGGAGEACLALPPPRLRA